MTADVEPLIEDSIDIMAAPATVWSRVTDLARMASWSPQVVRTIVRGGPVQLGTRAVSLNRQGVLLWPTRAKVVRFEPHREFAFRIVENWAVWSFSLEPTADGGTRLTERREAPHGVSRISTFLTARFLGGQQNFTDELRTGIRRTLEGIKADSER